MVPAAGQTALGSQRCVHRSAVAWLAVAALLSAGCTTMKPSQVPPETLRAQIRDGSAVQVGDRVTIITNDGRKFTMAVAALEADAIVGNPEGGARVTVPIDNVVALRTREIDVVRTGLAAVGGYLIVATALSVYAFYSMWEDILR